MTPSRFFDQKLHIPMDSEVRNQLELLPRRAAERLEMTPEMIRAIRMRRTFLGAWNLAQELSGLEDKQCYQPLGIDSSHWTKIRRGLASPPADERFVRYMDLTSEVPLVWIAEARGYDWMTIRKHRSSQEERIASLEEENRELRRAMTLWAEAARPKT